MLSMRQKSAASIVLVLLLWATATAWGAGREIKISMTESKYQPEKIVVRAGDTVTITLVNNSKQKKNHELMIGRKVVMGGPFGDRPEGFKKDFFHGVHVKFGGGKGVQMLMAGEAKLTGMKMKMGMGKEEHGAEKKDEHASKKMKMGKMKMGKEKRGPGKMEMGKMKMEKGGHRGFMIELKPKGTATISFTVPKDKVGEWEMGCFTDDGVHYKEGMHGPFVVKP